jgi:hypothetical protein
MKFSDEQLKKMVFAAKSFLMRLRRMDKLTGLKSRPKAIDQLASA